MTANLIGDLTATNLIGGLIFSGIGSVALAFGKKQGRIKTALFGVVLLLYPWFVDDTIVLYLVGIILTVCLFTFTD